MACRGIYLSVCLSLAVMTWSANGATTLDSLIDVALRNSPELSAAEQQSLAANFMARAAGRLPDPMLSLNILNLPRTSLRLDETPMSGVVFGLTQAIPWPAKLNARKRIAGLTAEGRAVDAAALRNSVTRQVSVAYYDYSYWSLAEGIIRNNLELTRLLVSTTEARYANGLGMLQDVLRARTTLARLENRSRTMVQMRLTSLEALAEYTGGSVVPDESLPARLPEVSLSPSDKPAALNQEDNPIVRQVRVKTKKAEAELSLEEASYWPDLTLGVDYRLRDNALSDPLAGEDFLSFRAAVTIPLWSATTQRRRTSGARKAIAASQERERHTELSLKRQVAERRLALDRIKESLEFYRNAIVPQAAAAAEAAGIAYEVGGVDFNAVLSAQLEQLEVELERLELLRQFHEKQAELRELLGQEWKE